MAWYLESHQTLRNHPKTLKLARLLGVSKPAAIGHLHLLWWWALDYAEDGDLGRFDALDVAVGAEWEGDPAAFLDALVRSGFLDAGGRIHDWGVYTGRLAAQRASNRDRQRRFRERHRDETGTDKPRNRYVTVTRNARNVASKKNKTNQNKTFGANAPPADEPPAPPESDPPDRPRERPVPTEQPAASEPFRLMQALTELTGFGADGINKRELNRQLGVAKRLLNDGYTEADVRGCIGYVQTQPYGDELIDLMVVEKKIGKWAAAGRPKAARSRASPAGDRTNGAVPHYRRADTFDEDAVARRLEEKRRAKAS